MNPSGAVDLADDERSRSNRIRPPCHSWFPQATMSTTEPDPFDWKRWPEAEALVARLLAEALERNRFAAELSRRMLEETSTRLVDWIDHLHVADGPGWERQLTSAGFVREPAAGSFGPPVYGHPGGMFPRVRVGGTAVTVVAIKVESVADFSRAHDLGAEPAGYPMGPYRTVRVAGQGSDLLAVERRGYRGFEPFPGELARTGRMAPHAARDALAARDLWHGRRRRFDEDEAGFEATE